VLTHLTDAPRRAHVIADNKLALNAGWDEQLLRLEVADLAAMAFDLSLIGFGEAEQTALLAPRTAGLTDPDDAPEPPEHPISEPGDLWLLGQIAKPQRSETGHSTQKPVECMHRPYGEQFGARPGGLRAVQRLGHDDRRQRRARPAGRTAFGNAGSPPR